MIGYHEKMNAQDVGRRLEGEEPSKEEIVVGNTWDEQLKAYEVGCMGRPYCFMLKVNKFADQSDDEFFIPRRNTGKIQYEYYVDLKGTPPESVDWTLYMTSVKGLRGATLAKRPLSYPNFGGCRLWHS